MLSIREWLSAELVIFQSYLRGLKRSPARAWRKGRPSPLGVGMSRSRDTELAIRLRFAQWEMSEAAHLIPAGRFNQSDAESLASNLEQIVKTLRDHPCATPGEVHGIGEGSDTTY